MGSAHALPLGGITAIIAGLAVLLACPAAILCCWRLWLVKRKAAASDDGWPNKAGPADRANSDEATGARARLPRWVVSRVAAPHAMLGLAGRTSKDESAGVAKLA